MTTNEAKRHMKALLTERKIQYASVTAKTISFSDLARANPIFVTVHGASMTSMAWADISDKIPKPSLGGYVPENEDTKWI